LRAAAAWLRWVVTGPGEDAGAAREVVPGLVLGPAWAAGAVEAGRVLRSRI
jgi:hypothetical protein